MDKHPDSPPDNFNWFTPWRWGFPFQIGFVIFFLIAGFVAFIAAIVLEEVFIIKDGFFY